MVSGACPGALKNLANLIRNQDGEWVKKFSRSSLEDAKRMITENDDVNNAYKGFLESYGHRCLKELDLMSKVWSEDPSPVIETLKSMVTSDHVSGKTMKAVDWQEKIESMKTPLSWGAKTALKFIGSGIHKATGHREETKNRIVYRINEIRIAVKKLAKSMAFHGYLPDIDLIFHLSQFEISQLLRTRSPLLIQK